MRPWGRGKRVARLGTWRVRHRDSGPRNLGCYVLSRRVSSRRTTGLLRRRWQSIITGWRGERERWRVGSRGMGKRSFAGCRCTSWIRISARPRRRRCRRARQWASRNGGREAARRGREVEEGRAEGFGSVRMRCVMTEGRAAWRRVHRRYRKLWCITRLLPFRQSHTLLIMHHPRRTVQRNLSDPGRRDNHTGTCNASIIDRRACVRRLPGPRRLGGTSSRCLCCLLSRRGSRISRDA